jgi:hypothetical protein
MKEKNDDKNRVAGQNNESANIPESSPSKPMDSKQDVEQANDPKIEMDFPGYPHYPSKEDIMDDRTDNHRVDVDVENLPNSRNLTGVSQRFPQNNNKADDAQANQEATGDDFSDIGPRTELTSDGLETLGTTNAEIGIPQNRGNDDLNKRMPGTDLDEEDDLDFSTATDADVTPEERMTLENISMPTRDEDNLRRAALDNTDFDGEELNEDSFGEVLSSADLDIPEEVDETGSTAMGDGDEENKYYSLGGDRQESVEEDPYSGPARDNY